MKQSLWGPLLTVQHHHSSDVVTFTPHPKQCFCSASALWLTVFYPHTAGLKGSQMTIPGSILVFHYFSFCVSFLRCSVRNLCISCICQRLFASLLSFKLKKKRRILTDEVNLKQTGSSGTVNKKLA